MRIGAVRKDPRGKISQSGEREHVFSVWTGDHILIKRYWTRAEAEEAREKIIRERGL